jgi:uncharacterized protein
MRTLLAGAALAAVTFLTCESAQAGPSFDCRKATTADEMSICASAELSALDVLNSTAFHQAKAINRLAALGVARAHLGHRRMCGYDPTCIRATFYTSLLAYQWLGATVVSQGPGYYSGTSMSGPMPNKGIVTTAAATQQYEPSKERDLEQVYFANCAAARAAGAAPIRVGEPGYRPKLDRDGDGVACE